MNPLVALFQKPREPVELNKPQTPHEVSGAGTQLHVYLVQGLSEARHPAPAAARKGANPQLAGPKAAVPPAP